jgi:hypothetical protein
MTKSATRTKLEQIAAALTGDRLTTSGYGSWLLSAKAWEKGGKSRIYFSGRFVDGDNHVSKNAVDLGYVELLHGEIVYATKAYHETAFRALVDPVVNTVLAKVT